MPNNQSLSPPRGQVATGEGSGVMIGDGIMLTAGHVMYEFNEASDPAARDVRTLSSAIIFIDPRDYLDQYRSIYEAFSPLPIPSSGHSISTQYIEPYLLTDDIVFVHWEGDVDQDDAGLALYINPDDIVTQYFGLVSGTEFRRWGKTTGEKEVNSGNLEIDPVGLRITQASATTEPGDSGGANWIDFENKEFIVGNNVATDDPPPRQFSVSSYITAAEFYQLNTELEFEQDAGDVTETEPTNLIVGSDSDDFGYDGTYRADIILGKNGNDSLNDGDAAGDVVWANDRLYGGAGNDTLAGGKGDDLLHGGDHRGYGGFARHALTADGEDEVDYSQNSDFGTVGITIEIKPSTQGDPTFAPSTGATVQADFDTAVFVKDNNSSDIDTLISVEKIFGTDANDTIKIQQLIAGNFADPGTGQGGILEIDLKGDTSIGGSTGDVVDFDGLTSAVTVNLEPEWIGEDARIYLTGSSDIGFTIKNAETFYGGDGLMEVWGNGNGEYHAGPGGGRFHLYAGDIAKGMTGVPDVFYVFTTVPNWVEEGMEREYLLNNRLLISNFGDEDQIYVNGVLFTGNNLTSSLALEEPILPNADGWVTSINLHGDSSYGTDYPAATFEVRGSNDASYVYPESMGLRHVFYTAADPNGTGIITLTSRTLTGLTFAEYSGNSWVEGGREVAVLDPFGPADEFLEIVIEGFSNGDGGISFSHDTLSGLYNYLPFDSISHIYAEASYYDSYGTFYTGTKVPVYFGADIFDGDQDGYSYGGGATVDAGDPLFGYGYKITEAQNIDWKAWVRGELDGPATEGFGPDHGPYGGSAKAATSISEFEELDDIDMVLVFAGDVNGDGYDDILASNPDGGPQGDGEAWLIFGNANGNLPSDLSAMSAGEGIRIASTADFGDIGIAINPAGDFNDDGYADFLIVGTEEADASLGGFLIYGKANGWADIDLDTLTTSEGFEIESVPDGTVGTDGVTGIGDINGDGFDDFALGKPHHGGTQTGGVYVVFGTDTQPSLIDNTAIANGRAIFILGGGAGDRVGGSVSPAGDINGDGIDDFLIAAHEADGGAGAVYAIFGRTTGFSGLDLANLSSSEGITISSTSVEGVGVEIAGLGDFNGDGLGDIAVAAAGAHTYIVYGSSTITDTDLDALLPSTGLKIIGSTQPFYTIGWDFAAAGDLNGDGLSDLLGTFGDILAVHGRNDQIAEIDPVFSSADETTLYTQDFAPIWTTAAGGDFNGDGVDDLVAYSRSLSFLGNPPTLTMILSPILGTDGDDVMTGTPVRDVFAGLGGNDVLNGGPGEDRFSGGDGDDTLKGNLGNDVLFGNDGNDYLVGGPGDDTMSGGAGDDTMMGNGGTDVFDGGAGTDIVQYNGSVAAVLVDLLDPANNTGDASGNSYISVENLQGSPNGDELRGDDDANAIFGRQGDDTLKGREGDDTLDGQNGNDTLYGEGGDDTYIFGPGYGFDLITDSGTNDTDTILIHGYDPADVTVSEGPAGSDAAILDFTGGTDQLTIWNTLDGDAADQIEQIIFDDGTIWTTADLLTMAQAQGGAGQGATIFGGEVPTGWSALESSDLFLIARQDGRTDAGQFKGLSHKSFGSTSVVQSAFADAEGLAPMAQWEMEPLPGLDTALV